VEEKQSSLGIGRLEEIPKRDESEGHWADNLVVSFGGANFGFTAYTAQTTCLA